MSKRFNSGIGGLTCDQCNILVVAGHPDIGKPLWIYPTKKYYVCKEAGPLPSSKEFHFCCRACMQRFIEKRGVKLRVAVIVSETKDA